MNYSSTIVQHYEKCFQKHGDNHQGVDWPNATDAATRYRIMLEVDRFAWHPKGVFSVLDYGCGLGHMYEYIEEHSLLLHYEGYDLSGLLVGECKKKYPYLYWHTENPPEADYVVMNGVLTERRELTNMQMAENVVDTIKHAWSLCRIGIAFNLMSKQVDWEREELYHQNMEDLASFLCSSISRNFIIRNDYKLYEYTAYVYK